MMKALELAEKGRLSVSPNPMVGAVVLRKGKVVGSGYHARFGAAHAEVTALCRADTAARGASLYVTLEPCATWGKTPPCVSAILRSGIRQVIIGTLDPNPKNHRKGVQALRQQGVKVLTGVLAKELEKQNESFFHHVRSGRPFVTLKMVQSLDGKIATATGESRWISSDKARKYVHALRAQQDAVMVGPKTLYADNPSLTVRRGSRAVSPEKPWRIVLDPKIKVSPRAKVFKGPQLTLRVVVHASLLRRNGNGHTKNSAASIFIPVNDKNGRLNMDELLAKLGALGVGRLMVEGGGELAWSLFEDGLVDRMVWVIAPKVLGGRNATTSVEGTGVARLARAISLEDVSCSRLGKDLLYEARPVGRKS